VTQGSGDREETEARLLRDISLAAPMMIWAMTPDGVCTYAVGRGLESAGLQPGELVGRNIIAWLGDDEGRLKSFRRAVAGESFHSVTSFAGTTFSTWWQPSRAPDGRIAEIVCVSLDIADSLRLREVEQELAGQQRAQALQLLAAQEFERSQLAQGMHDDTVQVLAAVDLRLDILRRRMEATADPALTAEVAELGDLLRGSVERLRRLIFALEPPSGEGPFVPALVALGGELLTPAGITFTVNVRRQDLPPERARKVLLAVAREAITNIAKHSKATSAKLAVTAVNQGTLLTVEDDGAGEPDSFVESPGHRGLRGMRERLQMLDGTLEVVAEHGRGTRVSAWVPDTMPVTLAGDVGPGLREPLREVLDSVDEAFMAVDRHWVVLFVNRSAGMILGEDPAALEGQNVWAHFPAIIRSSIYTQAHRAATQQRPVHVVFATSRRFLEIRLLPSPQGMFAFFRDITAERAAARDLGGADGAGAVLLAALTEPDDVGTVPERLGRLFGRVVERGWLDRVTVTDRHGEQVADTGEARSSTRERARTVVVNEPLPGRAGGQLVVETTEMERPSNRWLIQVLAALSARALAWAGPSADGRREGGRDDADEPENTSGSVASVEHVALLAEQMRSPPDA
jgi:PAS domain S-box-containing protein